MANLDMDFYMEERILMMSAFYPAFRLHQYMQNAVVLRGEPGGICQDSNLIGAGTPGKSIRKVLRAQWKWLHGFDRGGCFFIAGPDSHHWSNKMEILKALSHQTENGL